MKIDRLDLADCGSPESLILAILKKEPQLQIPVPIERLAQALDIRDIRELTTEGFEGALIMPEDRNHGVILVNTKAGYRRRRFTIGHELAHFLIIWHKPRDGQQFFCKAEDMLVSKAKSEDQFKRMEVQANRFSAGILMPAPMFRRDIRHHHSPNISQILELSEKYQTSKEATARRYVEFHDEACAVIVSHERKILRIYHGRDFPFLNCWSGDPVPSLSMTHQYEGRAGHISNIFEGDADVWVDRKSGSVRRQVFEQVLVQQNNYRQTLLIAEDVTESEDDAELLESWTPRFKR